MEKIKTEKGLMAVVTILLIIGALLLFFAVYSVVIGNIIYGILLYVINAHGLAINIYNLKNINHVQN